MNLAAAFALAILILVAYLFAIAEIRKDGFRGGEAIGDRTGGSAYSGAAADLDPQPF